MLASIQICIQANQHHSAIKDQHWNSGTDHSSKTKKKKKILAKSMMVHQTGYQSDDIWSTNWMKMFSTVLPTY